MASHPFVEAILNLLFPDRCAGCGHIGALICPACRAALAPYPQKPHGLPASLDLTHIAFIFEGTLRTIVHEFKYRPLRRLAIPLGTLLAASLRSTMPPIDTILPIPLHAERLAQRGFNQAEALAAEVARQTKLPLLTNRLQRIRATEQQAHLTARERRTNMHQAFCWHGPAKPPRRILLIDDVITTGATMGACAETLRAAGAEAIYGLALARSHHDHAPSMPTHN